MAFHQGQIEAGNAIIDKFTKEQPFTILLAQMQSGKTGTYLFTAMEMVRLGLVKNVVIICGSSDTSLRAQTLKDLFGDEEDDDDDGALKIYQRETMVKRDMEGALLIMNAKFGVYFSQDLNKLKDISEETLVIHDESHLAQSRNNIPFKKFYQKNNLDKALFGDFTDLLEKKCYILGVSATPFSELVANKKVLTGDWTTEESNLLEGVETMPKNFHFMMPGQGYIGVSDFLDNSQIKFEAENIKADDCAHITSILRKGSLKYHQKYVVVRTMCAQKDEKMMRTIASSCGYEYRSVFGGSEVSLDFMNTQPFKSTLVQICGKFRMGQVVPKQYIGMVYEQSSKPNADTILQGLVGRMCGYVSNGAHIAVDIYVSQMSEDLIRNYGRAWSGGDMDVLSEVKRAMNLGGVKRNNGGIVVSDAHSNQWIMTVPVRFNMSDIERGFEGKTKFGQIKPNDLINLIEDKPELLSDNPDKVEILNLLDSCAKVLPEKQSGASYLHHNTTCVSRNSEADFKALDTAIGKGKRLNISHYTQTDIKNLNKPEKVRFSPISVYGGDVGYCYLMGYVQYNPDKHGLVTEELATINPKCIYVPGKVMMEDGTKLDNVNGGQIIPFSIDTADDPDSFETELKKAIFRTIEDHPSYIEGIERAIHSLFDKETRLYEGIRLDKSVYTEERLEEIKQRLGRELGVQIVFKKSRGRQPKDQFKYASITW
jgi:hypothetical protein